MLRHIKYTFEVLEEKGPSWFSTDWETYRIINKMLMQLFPDLLNTRPSKFLALSTWLRGECENQPLNAFLILEPCFREYRDYVAGEYSPFPIEEIELVERLHRGVELVAMMLCGVSNEILLNELISKQK